VCGWLQIIVKEKGVFSNVTSPSTKAKLRLLFEVAPLALLVSLLPVCLLALGTLCCFICFQLSVYNPCCKVLLQGVLLLGGMGAGETVSVIMLVLL
jgi:hypothetical protein